MFDEQAILNELTYKAVKSSGAGGQHVNKTASKVELVFDLQHSVALSETQKDILKIKLQSRLSKSNILIMQCGESRSQFRNKAIVNQRFLELLKANLIRDKQRIPTKVPKSIVKKRLSDKRKASEKKANRKPPQID